MWTHCGRHKNASDESKPLLYNKSAISSYHCLLPIDLPKSEWGVSSFLTEHLLKMNIHLIKKHLFMKTSPQVWHTLFRDLTVLPVTHTEWNTNGMNLPLPSQPKTVLIHGPQRDERLSWSRVTTDDILHWQYKYKTHKPSNVVMVLCWVPRCWSTSLTDPVQSHMAPGHGQLYGLHITDITLCSSQHFT